jgi:hypothetical protein
LRVAPITIPWAGLLPAAVKGIVHVPAHATPIKPSRRETLLTAIGKARQWVDDVAQGRTATFAQIARRELRGSGPSKLRERPPASPGNPHARVRGKETRRAAGLLPQVPEQA